MKRHGQCCRLVMLMLSILMLGGCGKEGGEDGAAQTPDGQAGAASDTAELMAYKDMRYLPEFTDTSEKYGPYEAAGAGFAEDTFYLVKREEQGTADGGEGTGKLIAFYPDSGEEKVLLEREGMITAAPLKDGSAVVLSAGSDTTYQISKVDSSGTEVFSREYTDQALPEWQIDARLVADSQDRCYLLARDSILLFDGQGNAAGKVSLGGRWISRIVVSGSGKVYICESYPAQFTPVDFETAALGTSVYQMPLTTLRVAAPAREGDFLVSDDTTVYRYVCEEGKLTPLFDLQDSQISEALGIDTMGEMEDGRIFLFSRNQVMGSGTTEMALLSPTPLAECPVKDVVTIGTVNPGANLLNNVADFNRQNDAFKVSILNYSIGGRSYSEARAALKLDISLGKGPDICEIDWLDGPEDLFAKGCFKDLSGFFDGGGKYGREDFISQALDIYSYDGQLMAVPRYFSIQTIAARTDIAGDVPGWDLEDVKAVIQAHPDALVFAETSSSYMIDVCLRNMMGEFVDFDQKKADLDSPEFLDFLNFLKSLPDNYDDNKSMEYTSEWLRNGRALFSVRDIGRLTDLQVLEANFGGSYICIGYPSSDKSPDCIIRGREAYAITSSASDPDKAWSFLEWGHSMQGEESELARVTRIGFPTRTEVFERELKAASEGADAQGGNMGGISVSGTYVKYRKTTPEEIELLRSLIDCSSPEKSMEETILDIIYEETADLLGGGKSAEEVADVIQNRVQLYLDE